MSADANRWHGGLTEFEAWQLKHGRRAEEWDAFEAHFTPLPVAAQAFLSLATAIDPRVVVDLGAAAGGLGQAVGVAWPEACRIGVEIRSSEADNVRANYHEAIIDDLLRPMVLHRVAGRRPDLLVSNPPFSLALEFVQLALSVVAPGGHVAFLTRSTWGDHESVESFLRARPPVLELTIGGRVSMSQAGRACDQFGYQWLVWAAAGPPRDSAWPRLLLPRLATAQLGWTERPGVGSSAPARRLDRDLIVDLRKILGVPRG